MELGLGSRADSSVSRANLDITSSASQSISASLTLDGLTGPVHLAGIGGIGMSALARLLLEQGHKVSGSDKAESPITDELKSKGAEIFIGHKAENLARAGALVISTAIVDGNPELEEARRKGLPIWHRSELLSFLACRDKLVAITGTHGKTTTTAMVGQVLLDTGMDPSIVVGGIFHKIGANSRLGKGGYFVAESDESDGTHVRSKPYISVITNIEADHLENYPGGLDQILASMVKFISQTERFSLVCLDDKGCKRLLEMVNNDSPRLITYGSTGSGADYTIKSLPGFEMNVFRAAELLGSVNLQVPGEHNKLNALAAIAIGLEMGADFNEIAKAISTFPGVDRRFQIIGEKNEILVVDDYAHHPTEVAATLKAAKEYIQVQRGGKGRVVCLFQPHQPARLRDLWEEFTTSFTDADLVLLADVYIARGGKLDGIDSAHFIKAVKHGNAHHLPGNADSLPTQVLPYLKKGDLVLTVGAGDITKVGSLLLPLL